MPSLNPGQIEVVDREMAVILAGKSERERLEMGSAMWRSAREMLLRVVAAEHRQWDDQAISAEVARRMAHGAD